MLYKILLVILIGTVLRWLGKRLMIRVLNKSTSDEHMYSHGEFHVGACAAIFGGFMKYFGFAALLAYPIYKYIL